MGRRFGANRNRFKIVSFGALDSLVRSSRSGSSSLMRLGNGSKHQSKQQRSKPRKAAMQKEFDENSQASSFWCQIWPILHHPECNQSLSSSIAKTQNASLQHDLSQIGVSWVSSFTTPPPPATAESATLPMMVTRDPRLLLPFGFICMALAIITSTAILVNDGVVASYFESQQPTRQRTRQPRHARRRGLLLRRVFPTAGSAQRQHRFGATSLINAATSTAIAPVVWIARMGTNTTRHVLRVRSTQFSVNSLARSGQAPRSRSHSRQTTTRNRSHPHPRSHGSLQPSPVPSFTSPTPIPSVSAGLTSPDLRATSSTSSFLHPSQTSPLLQVSPSITPTASTTPLLPLSYSILSPIPSYSRRSMPRSPNTVTLALHSPPMPFEYSQQPLQQNPPRISDLNEGELEALDLAALEGTTWLPESAMGLTEQYALSYEDDGWEDDADENRQDLDSEYDRDDFGVTYRPFLGEEDEVAFDSEREDEDILLNDPLDNARLQDDSSQSVHRRASHIEVIPRMHSDENIASLQDSYSHSESPRGRRSDRLHPNSTEQLRRRRPWQPSQGSRSSDRPDTRPPGPRLEQQARPTWRVRAPRIRLRRLRESVPGTLAAVGAVLLLGVLWFLRRRGWMLLPRLWQLAGRRWGGEF